MKGQDSQTTMSFDLYPSVYLRQFQGSFHNSLRSAQHKDR